MRSSAPILLLLAASLAGCTSPGGPYPSLQPRPAEAIDPRLPVPPLSAPGPVSASLAAQLDDLVRQGRAGDSAFGGAMAEAERLAGAAGAPQSESWIAAQQALSAAAAARATTTKALGDIDAIAASQLERQRTISPADLAAVQQASAAVAAIDRAQHARIAAVSRRLGL